MTEACELLQDFSCLLFSQALRATTYNSRSFTLASYIPVLDLELEILTKREIKRAVMKWNLKSTLEDPLITRSCIKGPLKEKLWNR